MLNFFIKRIVTVALLGVVGGISAADDLSQVKLVHGGFKEYLRDSANISGAVVSGLQRQGESSGRLALSAYVPAKWAGAQTCIQVVSSDGRYEAYGPYAISSSWSGGFSPLEFPTEYHSELTQLNPNEISVLMSLGACTERSKGNISVATWNADPASQYTLLLNSFRADQVFLYQSEAAQPIHCERADVTSPITYDTKCSIELPDEPQKSVFSVYRVRDGKPSNPTEVTVWLPGK